MTTQDLFSLEGQAAIVTGGAGWIGSQITEALATAGARVFVADISAEAVSACVAAVLAGALEASPGFSSAASS